MAVNKLIVVAVVLVVAHSEITAKAFDISRVPGGPRGGESGGGVKGGGRGNDGSDVRLDTIETRRDELSLSPPRSKTSSGPSQSQPPGPPRNGERRSGSSGGRADPNGSPESNPTLGEGDDLGLDTVQGAGGRGRENSLERTGGRSRDDELELPRKPAEAKSSPVGITGARRATKVAADPLDGPIRPSKRAEPIPPPPKPSPSGRGSSEPRASPSGRGSSEPKNSPPGRGSSEPRASPPGKGSSEPRASPPGRGSSEPRASPPGRGSSEPIVRPAVRGNSGRGG